MRKLHINELDRLTVEQTKDAPKTPIILILDNIRSMQNVGSIFRTSDAFLVEKIYLCGITATPPNKEINKSALGATETVAWEYREDILELIKELKQNKTNVFAIEQVDGAQLLDVFVPADNKIALILGNEVKGVQQSAIDVSDGCIEIPQIGHKHSLNVSVSCGIVVWDIFNKIKKSL